MQAMQELLSSGASALEMDNAGNSALSYAAREGSLAAMRALLDAGASVHVSKGNNRGQTPLHWAAAGGHVQVGPFLEVSDKQIECLSCLLGPSLGPLHAVLAWLEPARLHCTLCWPAASWTCAKSRVHNLALL